MSEDQPKTYKAPSDSIFATGDLLKGLPEETRLAILGGIQAGLATSTEHKPVKPKTVALQTADWLGRRPVAVITSIVGAITGAFLWHTAQVKDARREAGEFLKANLIRCLEGDFDSESVEAIESYLE